MVFFTLLNALYYAHKNLTVICSQARNVLKEDINMGKELKNKLPEIETQISQLRSRIQSDLTEGDSSGLVEDNSPLDLEDLEEIM